MFAPVLTQRYKLFAVAVLLPLAMACSDDEPTGPAADPLVGTWQTTSIQVLGVDLVEQGMSIELTLTAARTYTVLVTGDLIGSCDPVSDCTDTGTYSFTPNQITMDAGTEDEVTFNYATQGTTMTFTGDVEGTPITMVLQRA